MQRLKVEFGIDAPALVIGFGIGGAVLVLCALATAQSGQLHAISSMSFSIGLSFLGAFLLMTLTSVWTKRVVLRRMVASLRLRGNEHVLDVGCGRGMLLLEAARQLSQGRATGLDLWSTRDQSGNAAAVTQRNAELAGLAERIQIDTGDMRRMPYPDATFDFIVSSLAIHNLATEDDRAQAIHEIARVLKPGGKVALLDFRSTGEYVRNLRTSGINDVVRSAPNPLMFPPVRIVRGVKYPTSSQEMS